MRMYRDQILKKMAIFIGNLYKADAYTVGNRPVVNSMMIRPYHLTGHLHWFAIGGFDAKGEALVKA